MDKKFVALMVLFLLVFGVFITSTLFNKQLARFTRASGSADPSPQTSLVFAWPLTAKIDEKVLVNVFIRSANNIPLDKKAVKLVTNFGSINGRKEKTVESDKAGKASFVLISKESGMAELTTFVNGNVQLKQKISVKFE